MDDQHLSNRLRDLPAPRAGEGFTRAVLARLDAEPPPAPWLTLPRLALVAAAVVAVVLALAPTFRGPRAGGAGAPVRVAEAESVPAAAAATPEEPEAEQPAAVAAIEERTPALRQAQEESATAPRPRAYVPDGRVVRVRDESAGPALGRDERARALERLAALRREQRQIEDRLAGLAALAAPGAGAPALLLAGDESVELVLDLDAGARSAPGVRPAAYQPDSIPRYY
jgi:hypothetical protein